MVLNPGKWDYMCLGKNGNDNEPLDFKAVIANSK